MRALLLLLFVMPAWAGTAAQCVELPYAGMPPQLWDRELVWMKNIGVNCVALADSPQLITVLNTVHKLELPAWILADRASSALRAQLDAQTEAHGGPVRWIGADDAPQPVHRVSAMNPQALTVSRGLLEERSGTILWTDVETTIFPALHRGALSLTGEEQPGIGALRRALRLVQQWQPLLGTLTVEQAAHGATGRLPDSVSARQFLATNPAAASAVSVINRGTVAYHGELRVVYPLGKQDLKLPELSVPPGGVLWLPLNLSLASVGRGNSECVVYATAELTQLEYENGILAMEFAAPAAGEVVLHLASEPVGPYLGAGKPRTFEWDAAGGNARLIIPAGSGPTARVRVALALQEPEISAFFGDTKVLTVGQRNTIVTNYSSEDVAQRARLTGPAWLKWEAPVKSPLQTEYSVTVPPTALHGSQVEFVLEADGARLSHQRFQLLRPVSLRVREAINQHWGKGMDLPLDPPLIPVDRKAGRDLSVTVRNNAAEIRTFTIEASGPNLEFAQPKTEVVVAGNSERDITARVFTDNALAGKNPGKFKVTGAADGEFPFELLVIPRGETVRYTEGQATVLESARARAVFTADRWTEFIWKDSEWNVLPEGGLPIGGAKPIDLQGAALAVEGSILPLAEGKQGEVSVHISRSSNQTLYTLSR